MIGRRKQHRYFDILKWRFVFFLKKNTFVCVLAILIILVSVTGFGISVIEHDDAYNSIWRSVVYVFSGMDVDPPKTSTGRILASLILFAGVVFVSLLTGYIASEFTRLLSSSNTIPLKLAKNKFQDHIIIFGWSNKTKLLLRELNADFGHGILRTKKFLIVSEEEYIDKGSENIYQQVYHLRGKPTDSEVLKKADLPRKKSFKLNGARVAVIFADSDLEENQADRFSLLSLLAIEHMHPDVVSVVEVRNASSKEHMQNACADEVVLPTNYTVDLIARTAVFPGVQTFISELLSLASDKDRLPVSFYVIYAKEVGGVGETIANAVNKLFMENFGVIIGVLRDSQLTLISDNPVIVDEIVLKTDFYITIAVPQQIYR
jgi:voltage-gated potassium channel